MDSNSYFIENEDTATGSTLAKKVRLSKRAIFYELVPPANEKNHSDIEKSVSLIVSLLSKLPIDGINIPEVHEEKRNGSRNTSFTEKLEPRALSTYLYSAGFSNIIVNRPIVHLPWDEQRVWLQETYQNNSIRNFIFVGGESSKIQYPGFSVTQAAAAVTKTLKSEFPDIFLGGIAIPSRLHEAQRLFKKAQAGIEFFTTQVLYESDSIKQLLSEYWDLCLEHKTEPKMICLSFAPATTERDLSLLSWLGVKIPQATYEVLTTGWLGMGWNSLSVCQTILEDIFHFVKSHDIRVPLGLNVGYINRHNFEFSVTFLEQLSAFYLQNQIREKRRVPFLDYSRQSNQQTEIRRAY